jgi:macrolide transport system ATP-binding/permease protein
MNQAETDILFQLKNVSYTYTAVNTPSFLALKNLNLSISRGEFVAIIGPSGSGKSTLMHLLGIMADPTEGELLVRGSSTRTYTTNEKAGLRNSFIGFLFQQFFLLPQLTVLENILLPTDYQTRNKGSELPVSRAMELIERFGLSGQEHKKPANLSGGQRQRVALCRALVMNPEVLLCDEPTGALDSNTAREVLNTLAELHSSGGTIIVITHDPEVARRAQRIVRIVDGQIISDSSADEGTRAQINNFSKNEMTTRNAKQRAGIASQIVRTLRHMFIPTWQALQTQKLRTALTMTGLLLGVSSVFIMLTMTGRVREIFEDFFATQGSRKAFVSFDGRLADRTGAPRWRGLNIKTDLPKLNAQLKPLGRLDPNVDAGGCQILSGAANIQSSLTGINSLQEARENDLRIARGRLPMPHEFESSSTSRIALLGSDAAVKLFPPRSSASATDDSPLGQNIIVRGCEFVGILRVVGILKPIDSLFDRGVNSTIYLPTQTLLAGGASTYKTHFTAVPSAGISPTGFAQHVIGKLSVMTSNQFPFRYFAAEKELEKFNLMMGILTGLTLVIGGLCTLIGGIGVMNIMLVNVHERIQEIGIRKAVGARDTHIQWQFLLESTGLCLISGALGLLVGIAVSTAAFFIARFFLPQVENLSFQPDPVAILVALTVSLGAGLLFGTWPAQRAAALDVVDALKQE